MITILRNIYDEMKGKGGIVGFYNFAEPSYFVTDIELAKLIMVKNFNSFVNRGEVLGPFAYDVQYL
jgi:hypothetical protein